MEQSNIDKVINLPRMTGGDLQSWIDCNGLTRDQAAKLLGISGRHLRNCLAEDAADKPIKRVTQFACYYVTVKLQYLMQKRAREVVEDRPLDV